MIKISRRKAMQILKAGHLHHDLVEKGITVLMKESEAVAWLAALRDGRQRQASRVLYDPTSGGSFCCLGLEQSCNWGGKVEVFSGTQVSKHPKFNSYPSFGYLALTKKGYYDFHGRVSIYPHIRRWGQNTDAPELNDTGTPFSEIADLLETHMAVY